MLPIIKSVNRHLLLSIDKNSHLQGKRNKVISKEKT